MLVLEPLVAVLLGQVILGEHLAVSTPSAVALGSPLAAMAAATIALGRDEGAFEDELEVGRTAAGGAATVPSGDEVWPSDPLAQIAAGPAGPAVGAFFDLDGTLVAGFTAAAHAGDRIRRGQARIGEVLGVVEASVRYKLGRMQFERLLARGATYLRGESLAELDEVGERVFAEQVAHKVYPLMRADRRRAPGPRPHRGAELLGVDHPRRTGCPRTGYPDVVCNTFELDDDGLLTGRVEPGRSSGGAQKAAAVQDFAQRAVSNCRRATSTPTATRTPR